MLLVVFLCAVFERPGMSYDARVTREEGSYRGEGSGGILYTIRNNVPSFTHYNSRGDVVAKTNTTGAITYQALYEAFGKRTMETGSTLDREKANTKQEDPTGLLNEGFRYRDLDTGVFITRDPLMFIDGPNMYTYVEQNPWTKFDPEGLNPNPEVEAAGLIEYMATEPERFPGQVAKVEKAAANLAKAAGNAEKEITKDVQALRKAMDLDKPSKGSSEQHKGKVTNPDGRNGSPEHQADVAKNNDQKTGQMNPEPVGNRVPDGVGATDQTVNIRGQDIKPEQGARVIAESDKINQNGQVNSAGRAQMRDIRAADPNATMVVTDHTDPSKPPMIFPPGTQPPAPGRLPSGTPTSVPAIPVPPPKPTVVTPPPGS